MTRKAERHDSSMAIEELFVTYKTVSEESVPALEDVSLEIRPGEFLVIVGPSGCGKSTLLKVIAGLIEPTRGACHLNGETVQGPRDDVGFVFQSPLLLPWATTLKNVLLPAELQGIERDFAQRRAAELITLVGLNGFSDKYPKELSGGMQQRAGIARALIHDPKLLLMDEPFGALDALTRERLNGNLQEIWAETRKTIVFVTHSVPEAVTLASRIVVMTPRPGRIRGIIDVNLGRPRLMDVLSSSEGIRIQRTVREMLELE